MVEEIWIVGVVWEILFVAVVGEILFEILFVAVVEEIWIVVVEVAGVLFVVETLTDVKIVEMKMFQILIVIDSKNYCRLRLDQAVMDQWSDANLNEFLSIVRF